MKINNVEDIASQSILILLFLVVLWCGYISMNIFWGDPTIYLIYAKNIAQGYGLSFNPGEFSSGATSPLWALILTIGFIFNNGILLSKIISIIFTLIALSTTYISVYKITKSKLGSAIGTGFLSYFLLFPSLLIYESSIIVSLVSILILLNLYLIQYKKKNYLWMVGIVWALMPLIRPESLIMILINFFIIAYYFRNDKLLIYKLVLVIFLSLLPSISYFAYSYLKLGVLSTSTYCRAFSLKNSPLFYASNYLPYYMTINSPIIIGFLLGIYGLIKGLKEKKSKLWFIFSSIIILISFFLVFTTYSSIISYYSSSYWLLYLILDFPITISISIGVYGLFQIKRTNNGLKWLIFFSLASFISYFLIFTFYSPPKYVYDAMRYILIILPFIIIFISMGISKIVEICNKKSIGYYILLIIIITTIIAPSVILIQTFNELKNENLYFDTITEKNAINYLNSIAEPNSTVLAFEVQDRYYLRQNLKILSLDGITDGKIAPYLNNHNLDAFLWKYKPRYLIMNRVITLPFYSNTVLGEVLRKTGNIEGSSIKIDNITFKNIKIRDEPDNSLFWGYTQIYELSYE